MVCGASSTGKTSFIELFLKKFNYKKALEVINSKSKDPSNFSYLETPKGDPVSKKDTVMTGTSNFHET